MAVSRRKDAWAKPGGGQQSAARTDCSRRWWLVGAQPDLRLTWSYLSAVAELWSAHPGIYKVADEAENLNPAPAPAQMSIKALAAEVRESVPSADQRERLDGELILPGGAESTVTVRDVANKGDTRLSGTSGRR